MPPRVCRLALAVLSAAALLLGALPGDPPPAGAVARWSPGPVAAASPGHAALGLPDGRVILLGGYQAPGGAAGEILDPAAGTSRPIAPWPGRARLEAAVRLDDGRLFLSGGAYQACVAPGCYTTVTDAYTYDPAADRWAPAASLPAARNYHAAITLRDGTVLVVGGCGGGGIGAAGCYGGGTTEALRYDPAADRWTGAGQTASRHIRPVLTLLADGRVLATAGTTRGTPDPAPPFGEVYDPATGRWSRTGPTRAAREGHTATLLADGRILVAGGIDARADRWTPVASAELYDPVADRWSRAGAMATPRQGHTATALPDGGVLVVGGNASARLASAELYDPATGRWAGAAPLAVARAGHSATRLPDGRVLVAGGADAAGPAPTAIYGEAGPPEVCFPPTGRCVRGPFRAYWEAHGGLAIHGYPLTEERRETLEDGRVYTVQYFERARFEHHPEHAGTPHEVLLGHFGRRVLRAQFGDANDALARFREALAPVAPAPPAAHFAQTGHNLGGRFRAYWEAHGGLAQFGLPLTEERRERLENGEEYTVQYFERARFEHHPANAPPHDVLLGQFGRRIEREAAVLAGDFGRLYLGDEGVRDQLGAPRGAATPMPGAILEFERGRMLWLGGARTDFRGRQVPVIYVLAGAPAAGTLHGAPRLGDTLAWPDTWEEGEAPGGGAGPGPALFTPARGFGKVWRLGAGLFAPGMPPSDDVRGLLGYALAPGETGYALSVQAFQGGALLSIPDGRAIYVLATTRRCTSCLTEGTYQRHELTDED